MRKAVFVYSGELEEGRRRRRGPGYRYFTDVDAFREYIRTEILALESMAI